MDSDDENCPRSVTHYGMLESRRHLKLRGFHPDVTSRTPSEVETDAIEYLMNKVNLPGRSQYIASQKALLGQGGGYGYRNRPRGTIIRRLTKGPWFVTATLAEKPAFKEAANRPKDVPADPKDALPIAPEIGAVTGHMYLGPKIMQDVFRDGHQTAMKLSLASSKMYKLVSDNVNRWDFCAMEYVVKVPSSVMVVVVPQHTVGDILEAQKRYKLQLNSPEWTAARQKLESQGDFDNYKLRSIEVEQTFFEWAQTWRIECLRAAGPYWVTKDGEIDPRTTDRAKEWWDEDKHAINVMGSLKPLDKMWSANQFEGTVYKLHKMPISLAMESLFKLMVELHRARSHVEVLHLHNVPLLDRRMLAIMLRGLPHVTMVGVYNCPLIHFGDVIPILDLIYEINQDRKEKNMPEIKAFDFFPCFNQGMPFAHKNAATYGISWEPIAMELAQPGFYGIILKAVMKSKGMGLDLLFSPDHAFMDYLVKVPNLPLGVYSFLDAVYRYLEVKRDDRNRCNLKLQAIYDMLKPIRIELDPRLEKESAQAPTDLLRLSFAKALDDEEDHWKTRKKDLLDKLCPDWEPSAFNQDSTETVRPRQDHPPFLVDGLLRLAPFWQALVRDQKRVYDSLAQLPSLEDVALDLATGRRWQDAVIFAIKEDVLRLSILELKSSYQHGVKRKSIPAYGTTRKDGGAPDHQDELQPPVFDEDWVFYDHKNALRLALWLKKRDW
ncbi:hypothetical protein TrVFT333_003085 [Trichoderma virens FT-333]|nr:hypothetical protein TrVFT333_003085 [Trichoderma virens FT-333]